MTFRRLRKSESEEIGKRVKKEANKKKRRPFKKQEQSKAKIYQYFVEGHSVDATARQTGHSYKSVKAYFQEWTEELIDNTDLILQENGTKERLVLALDRRIQSLMKQEKRLLARIGTKLDVRLEMALLKVNIALTEIHKDKARIFLIPMSLMENEN